MPPNATPQQPAARPSPGPGPEPDREPPDPGRSQSTTPAPAPRHRDVAPRDFVRLFQCRVCSLPLREPVSLPCGKTMCRRCLPETHRRSNITYPAAPDRLRGFKCPFSDCAREHALDDCAVDVVLNKTAGHVRDEIDRRKLMVHGSTRVEWPDPWAAAGITSMREDDAYSKVIQGGKVVATYSLAEEGDLSYETDITYNYIPSPPTSPSPTSTVDDDDDTSLVRKAQDATRAEMDCQVCYALFYDPLTTPCGHTFCRSCLHRILDHSRYCPICRRPMAINPVLSQNSSPSNETITRIIEAFWLDEVHARKDALDAERASQMQDFDLPLFVCTLSFPLMPTFLHIFEPRYRLMIRRALEGDRTFGMVLPKRPQHPDDVDFHDLGTLLRIVNIQYYPDGRSLIETVGLSRFRVRNHSYLDGYTVAKTERVDDVSLEQEEAMEAMEAVPPSEQPTTGESSSIQGDKDSQDSPSLDSPPPAVDTLPMPASPEDIDAMSTQSLMQFASSFVARMRVQSVPWLTERMLTIYGECPDDAAIFPWWFASMLPVKDLEKYRLLGTSSVRERLKICCSWIIEWQTSRWTKLIDGRSGLSTAAQSSD